MNQEDVAGVIAVEGVDDMTGMEYADDELLPRIATGDAGAFEVLYARHATPLTQHLTHLVHDANIAADLTQEAFLRVWLRAEQWDGRGSGKGWLFRIATNLALNHLRTLRRRHEQPLEIMSYDEDETIVPGWMVDAVTGNPQVFVEATERLARLQQIVDDLPETKREVIRLVYGEEMDIHHAAEMLGVPEGTIKSRLHHARKHLARQWKYYEEEEC